MPPYASSSSSSSDNRLSDLFQTLWASKLWIVLTTLVVTLAAAAYAYLATPVYEATVNTLPPTASGLASYNTASQLTGSAISGMLTYGSSGGIDELTTEEAYSEFLLRLTSNSVRQKFFDQFYLPAHDIKTGGASEQRLWRQLGQEVTIQRPVKPEDKVARLIMQGKDPELTAKWANAYVGIAIDSTREDLLSDLAGEVEVRKKGVNDQIQTLRDVAAVARQGLITRVENALQIAEAIGLEIPPPGSSVITVGSGTRTMDADGALMYLRGAKALRSELEQLKQRTSDDAYIPELGDLLKKRTLLDNIDLNPERLTVAIIDRAAVAPEDPIKPRKRVIILLGLVLGALLGVFLALLRRVLR
jgi:chain length determinant protein (polysaccharide antigen chain regulator)